MNFDPPSRGAASFLLRLRSFLLFFMLFLALLLATAPVHAQAGDPGPRWTLTTAVAAPAGDKLSATAAESARADLQAAIRARLSDPGVGVQVSADGGDYTVQLSGTGLDLLRRVVFTDLRDQIRLTGSGLEVRLNAPAARGQRVTVTLEGNISTGYGWEWEEIDPAQFSLVGEPQAQPMPGPNRLGAPQRQTVVLEAAADGDLSARLVYRRSWLAEAPRSRLDIQADALPAVLDLSDPAFDKAAPFTLAQAGPRAEAPIEPQALPARFDWRDQNKVSAVKDQGGCGSCWAFGVVGVLESAVKVQLNAPESDLSEQFLVNCNTYGYDCDGGWWDSHDFHYNRVKAPQVEPGSVTEAQLPYTATNGSCSVNYAKGYRLTRWQYISNQDIPEVDEIKQAILSYGPVGSAVCVGNAFSHYTGGVFSTSETCGSGLVNHAVVLVGWDDSTQTWIMKNSWDTWWGEDGYMRIRYGTSKIGFWANYAVVQPTAPAQVLPAANAVTSDFTPEFTWQAIPDALDYQLQVAYTSVFSSPVMDVTTSALTYTPEASLTSNMLHYWRVRARLANGYSIWSAARALKTLPSVPVPSSPVNQEVVRGLRPALAWTEVGTANKYEVQISTGADFSALTASGFATTLTWTPAADLPRNASLFWRARAVGTHGTSAWSSPGAFTTLDPPQPPVLSSPVSAVVLAAGSRPTFSWRPPAISVPAGYHIQFSHSSKFATAFHEADVTGTTYAYPVDFPANALLYWRVASYNGAPRETSAYSGVRSLKILPAVPGIISPLGAPVASLRPTLTWEAGSNKPTYDLQVSKYSGCVTPFKATTLTASAYTFTSDLARRTTYTWRVRGRGLYGVSAWSACQSFVTPDPPSTPAVVSPATGSTLAAAALFSPTFVWKVSSNSPDGYILQLSKGSTFNASTAVEQVIADPAQTSFTWPEPLAYGTYTWRMRSYRAGPEYSNWTSARSFKTQGGLQGVVTEDGQPVEGVKVAVSGTTLSAYTDAAGVYLLAAVPAGARTVIFSKTGYLSVSKSVTVSAGSLRALNVTVKKITTP